MLAVTDLAFRYGATPVFEGVHLQLARGEFVALLGESGVGKSTLLNCIAGLETPSAGRIELDGQDLAQLDDDGRARLRRDQLGFVFQAFHLLPHLSVAENVSLPLRLQGRPFAEAVTKMLDAVGLQGLEARLPAQLSGGQLQRVAIARALVHGPALILADEPTGNLDPDTGARVLGVLKQQVRAAGAALLLVTHSVPAAALADRRLQLGARGMRDA